MKTNEDPHLSKDRRDYLMAMTPLGASILAAEKYAKALADGQEHTNAANRENLVKQYRDGGRNTATEQAGRARKKDTTIPHGQDRTGQNVYRGHYAAAIADSTTTKRQANRGRYVRGNI